MFLEHYFDRYTFQLEKGLAYGFEKSGTGYEYQCPVLSDTFPLKVSVCDQKISFQVYDQDTGDEYIQIHLEQLQRKFRWPSQGSLSGKSCKNPPSLF